METASPAEVSDYRRLREEVRIAVKEIIASIKLLEEGPDGIPDDARLFSDGLSEPSPIELDSLDALDLALALKEKFDPEGSRFEAFLDGNVEMERLSTVREITDYVMQVMASTTDGTASPRTEPSAIESTMRSSQHKGGF